MPLYCFRCPDGHDFEQMLSMKDCMKKQKCPECGKRAIRNLIAEHASGTVDSQMREYSFDGETGTRLYGASYLPNQKEIAKKKHPGVDFIEHNGCLLPRIHNRREKLRYLKDYGNYIEYD